MVQLNDNDAVNQYDFPSIIITTTTTTTTGSTTTTTNTAPSQSKQQQQQQQQDIDFDLFTANAQVILDNNVTNTEGIVTNVDTTPIIATDMTTLHYENNNTDHNNNYNGSDHQSNETISLSEIKLPLSSHNDPPVPVIIIHNNNNNDIAPTGNNTTNTHKNEESLVVVKEKTMTTTTTTPEPESDMLLNATTPPPPSSFSSSSTQLPPLPRFVSPKDFELLKVIGMGAFGKVLQVRNKCTHHIYAMKIISKRLLYKKGTSVIDNVLVERNILQRISSHPFIVTMQCSFQTREKLFIIMDYLAGGELFLRLGREGIFLEKTAAFYLAEIILAIEHLHNNNILHRDLKPENILLSCDGHVCITDFGLAKDFTRESEIAITSHSTKPITANGTTSTDTSNSATNNDIAGTEAGTDTNDKNDKQSSPDDDDNNNDDQHRAKTICGTGEYMAPEMIARQGYGRSADYWSLGCIAYEMLSGRPPFDSKQGAKILFLKIMTERIKMPSGSSAAACKLLKGLLNRNVSARLGAAKSTMFEVGGVAGLKKVDFFALIDWDKLLHKQIDPPATFSVDHECDVQYFHDEFTTMPLPRSVVDMSMEHYQAKRVESEAFRGFSFIHDDFVLPSRNDVEEKAYWESIEEDGESLSDCASSAMGNNEQEQLSPTPSKRPPRKRKKKGAATPGSNGDPAGSVVSATTTPMGTANNTPLGSTANTPEPSECGDIIDQLDTLGINDDNVSPLVTNVIKAVIHQSKLNVVPNPASPRVIASSSQPERTPPLTTKPIVQEEEWCVASSKKETPGKQKQRNSLTQHMNNNSNPTGSTGKTPWSAANLQTPPVPPFTRNASTITSANQRNGIYDTSKRVETASFSPQQQKQLQPSTGTPPVNSRANGWNLAPSSLSKNNTVGGLQRLSPSPAQQQQSWRPTAGSATTKSTSMQPSGPTSRDWQSSRSPVSTAPSSDWRNHSMANRINVDQQQQQRGSRAQSDLQSKIPAALPASSNPVATVWPSLTKGETLSKNASVNSGSTGTNSTTKTPIVTGAWAARASKS